MRPARVRSRLLTAACLILIGLAWVYLAPTQIGGSTQYVITDGISMEPGFHTGDLALVRPVGQYRVGDVVAYHSTLLHVVVLHRIIGRAGEHYIFKGDNNNFVDPTQPVRSQLVGRLWLHIPHGGLVLHWVHTPLIAALIIVAFGLLALLTAGETQRRRRRRRRTNPSDAPRTPAMKTTDTRMRAADLSAIQAVATVGLLVCVVLAVIAFARPLDRRSAARVPYTQQIHFAYRAGATPGPVYPSGTVTTGQPIFLTLVHRVRFTVDYRFATAAQHDVAGSEQVFLTLTGSMGWSRSLPLSPRESFRGPGLRTDVTVDLAAVQSLITRVQQMTATPGGAFTLALSPRVHIRGTVAGQSLDARYDPTLNFALSASQLAPAASTSPGGGAQGGVGYAPSHAGAVDVPAITGNRVGLLHQTVSVAALRWAAILGLFVSVGLALLVTVAKRLAPSDEAARIQAEYGHLIVPVVGSPEGLGGVAVDVPTIDALARLAESGQRLILHSREQSRDTYLLNDEGTIYRYRAEPGSVVWGEWSAAGPRPLAHVAAPPRRPAPRHRPAGVSAASATDAPAIPSEPSVAPTTPATVAPAATVAATPVAPATSPIVFPPPAFLADPPVAATSDTLAPRPQSRAAEPAVPRPASPRPASPRPSAPRRPTPPRPNPARATASPRPAPARPAAVQPRLKRWVESQVRGARAVRDLGAAFLGTGQR